jgi:hypothetical protein
MQRIESYLANNNCDRPNFFCIGYRIFDAVKTARKKSEVFPFGHQVAALAADIPTGSKS